MDEASNADDWTTLGLFKVYTSCIRKYVTTRGEIRTALPGYDGQVAVIRRP
jgi:hypothetical protein